MIGFARMRPYRLFLALAALALPAMAPVTAHALSEIQTDGLTAPEQTPSGTTVPPGAADDAAPVVPGQAVPAPDPVTRPTQSDPVTPDDGIESEPGSGPAIDDEAAEPDGGNEAAGRGPIPEVLHDLALLPEPVRRLHGLLVEACVSGDIEKLRLLISTGERATQLSLGGIDGDPVAFLKELSGDGEGHEILAILLEVLQAGYVHLDAGKPEELYVWPYFFAVPLDSLTPPQRVELFKIVTAGDYEDMKAYGSYIFYRVGITPEGEWAFFVAGD